MARTVLPQVYFDEHIKPPVVDSFRAEGFKCVLISKTKKYAGRDEKDYIGEIYAEGKPFVTSDSEFVIDYVVERDVKHAGIILIPKDYNDASDGELHTGLAHITKTLIQGLAKNALRRHIVYIAGDGLRVLDDKGKDDLWFPALPNE